MDAIWLNAPWPAWRVQAGSVQPNAAARQWALQAGLAGHDLQALAQAGAQAGAQTGAQAPAQANASTGPQALQRSGAHAGADAPEPAKADLHLQLGPLHVQCRALRLPDGALLLWLQPQADAAAAARHTQLLASQAQLVASALGVGSWSLDHDNASGVGTWDAQMYKLYDRAPALGPPAMLQWLAECVHPQDQAEVLDRVLLAHAQDAQSIELLFRLVKPGANGQTRWMQSWSCRGSGPQRRISFGMHLDVSERQHALALQHDKQRLEQASREQSAFMARMSHELRTPMNAVIGFTRLLQTEPDPLTERQRQRLGYIAAASVQLMALIDDLLAITAADAAAKAAGTAAAKAALNGPHAAAPQNAVPASGMQVLCVEDNPVNLQLVRELIALRPAVQLRTAVDGLSGVASALAAPPHLVLLDLQLPDIDGLEVMRRLRAAPTTAGCSIVALSADAMPEHIKTALAAGFDDYWTKPIQFDAFLAGIDRLAQQLAPGA